MSELQVFFMEVDGPIAKKECLGILTAFYFLKGWRLLFLVENEAAATYLDQLLWSYPPEAMLPHVIGCKPTRERILITWNCKANLNQAELLFNLQAKTLKEEIQPPCKLVIELWDHSSPQREQKSLSHWEYYQRQEYLLERRGWERAFPMETLVNF